MKLNQLIAGEAMPIPPNVKDAELERFHAKLMDYLRRLSTKLSQAISNVGAIGEGLVSTREDDQSVVHDAEFSVEWKRDIHLDTTVYVHSIVSNPSEITVQVDGVYLIWFDTMHDFTVDCDFWVEIFADSTWAQVDFSRLDNVPPNETQGLAVGVPMISGTKFRIRGQADAGDVASRNLFFENTRLSVLRIARTSHGGIEAGDPGDPKTPKDDNPGGIGWDSFSVPSWASS